MKTRLPSATDLNQISRYLFANLDDDTLRGGSQGDLLREHYLKTTTQVQNYIRSAQMGTARQLAVLDAIGMMKELIEYGDYNLAYAVHSGIFSYKKDLDEVLKTHTEFNQMFEMFNNELAPRKAKEVFTKKVDTDELTTEGEKKKAITDSQIPLRKDGSYIIPPIQAVIGNDFAAQAEIFSAGKMRAREEEKDQDKLEQRLQEIEESNKKNIETYIEPIIQRRNALPLNYKNIDILNKPQQELLGQLRESAKINISREQRRDRLTTCLRSMDTDDKDRLSELKKEYISILAEILEAALNQEQKKIILEFALRFYNVNSIEAMMLKYDPSNHQEHMTKYIPIINSMAIILNTPANVILDYTNAKKAAPEKQKSKIDSAKGKELANKMQGVFNSIDQLGNGLEEQIEERLRLGENNYQQALLANDIHKKLSKLKINYDKTGKTKNTEAFESLINAVVARKRSTTDDPSRLAEDIQKLIDDAISAQEKKYKSPKRVIGSALSSEPKINTYIFYNSLKELKNEFFGLRAAQPTATITTTQTTVSAADISPSADNSQADLASKIPDHVVQWLRATPTELYQELHSLIKATKLEPNNPEIYKKLYQLASVMEHERQKDIDEKLLRPLAGYMGVMDESSFEFLDHIFKDINTIIEPMLPEPATASKDLPNDAANAAVKVMRATQPTATTPIETILSTLENYLKKPLPQSPSEDKFVQLVDQYDRALSDPQNIAQLQSHPELIERSRKVNAGIQSVYETTMSAMTAKLYNQLKFKEYAKMSTDDIVKDCQSLIDLTLYQNELVRNHILSIQNKEQRNIVFERYIFLAKQLLDSRNFFSAKAIYDALNFTEIRRLGAESVTISIVQIYQWQGLSSAAVETIRYMETLFGQDEASKTKLRELADASNEPSLISINKVTQILEMDFKAQCEPAELEKINLEDIIKFLDKIVAAKQGDTDVSQNVVQFREFLEASIKKLQDGMDSLSNITPKPKKELNEIEKEINDNQKEINAIEDQIKRLPGIDKDFDFGKLEALVKQKALLEKQKEIKSIEDRIKLLSPGMNKDFDFSDLQALGKLKVALGNEIEMQKQTIATKKGIAALKLTHALQGTYEGYPIDTNKISPSFIEKMQAPHVKDWVRTKTLPPELQKLNVYFEDRINRPDHKNSHEKTLALVQTVRDQLQQINQKFAPNKYEDRITALITEFDALLITLKDDNGKVIPTIRDQVEPNIQPKIKKLNDLYNDIKTDISSYEKHFKAQSELYRKRVKDADNKTVDEVITPSTLTQNLPSLTVPEKSVYDATSEFFIYLEKLRTSVEQRPSNSIAQERLEELQKIADTLLHQSKNPEKMISFLNEQIENNTTLKKHNTRKITRALVKLRNEETHPIILLRQTRDNLAHLSLKASTPNTRMDTLQKLRNFVKDINWISDKLSATPDMTKEQWSAIFSTEENKTRAYLKDWVYLSDSPNKDQVSNLIEMLNGLATKLNELLISAQDSKDLIKYIGDIEDSLNKSALLKSNDTCPLLDNLVKAALELRKQDNASRSTASAQLSASDKPSIPPAIVISGLGAKSDRKFTLADKHSTIITPDSLDKDYTLGTNFSRVVMSAEEPKIEEMQSADLIVLQDEGQVIVYWIQDGKLTNHAFDEKSVQSILNKLPKVGSTSTDITLINEIISQYKCTSVATSDLNIEKQLLTHGTLQPITNGGWHAYHNESMPDVDLSSWVGDDVKRFAAAMVDPSNNEWHEIDDDPRPYLERDDNAVLVIKKDNSIITKNAIEAQLYFKRLASGQPVEGTPLFFYAPKVGKVKILNNTSLSEVTEILNKQIGYTKNVVVATSNAGTSPNLITLDQSANQPLIVADFASQRRDEVTELRKNERQVKMGIYEIYNKINKVQDDAKSLADDLTELKSILPDDCDPFISVFLDKLIKTFSDIASQSTLKEGIIKSIHGDDVSPYDYRRHLQDNLPSNVNVDANPTMFIDPGKFTIDFNAAINDIESFFGNNNDQFTSLARLLMDVNSVSDKVIPQLFDEIKEKYPDIYNQFDRMKKDGNVYDVKSRLAAPQQAIGTIVGGKKERAASEGLLTAISEFLKATHNGALAERLVTTKEKALEVSAQLNTLNTSNSLSKERMRYFLTNISKIESHREQANAHLKALNEMDIEKTEEKLHKRVLESKFENLNQNEIALRNLLNKIKINPKSSDSDKELVSTLTSMKMTLTSIIELNVNLDQNTKMAEMMSWIIQNINDPEEEKFVLALANKIHEERHNLLLALTKLEQEYLSLSEKLPRNEPLTDYRVIHIKSANRSHNNSLLKLEKERSLYEIRSIIIEIKDYYRRYEKEYPASKRSGKVKRKMELAESIYLNLEALLTSGPEHIISYIDNIIKNEKHIIHQHINPTRRDPTQLARHLMEIRRHAEHALLYVDPPFPGYTDRVSKQGGANSPGPFGGRYTNYTDASKTKIDHMAMIKLDTTKDGPRPQKVMGEYAAGKLMETMFTHLDIDKNRMAHVSLIQANQKGLFVADPKGDNTYLKSIYIPGYQGDFWRHAYGEHFRKKNHGKVYDKSKTAASQFCYKELKKAYQKQLRMLERQPADDPRAQAEKQRVAEILKNLSKGSLVARLSGDDSMQKAVMDEIIQARLDAMGDKKPAFVVQLLSRIPIAAKLSKMANISPRDIPSDALRNDAYKKQFAEITAPRLLLSDFGVHCANFGTVKIGDELQLAAIDYGAAFSNFSKTFDPFEPLAGMEFYKNHMRDYTNDIYASDEMAKMFIKIGLLFKENSRVLDNTIKQITADLDKFYGVEPLKEFCNRIGLEKEKVDLCENKPELMALLSFYFKQMLVARADVMLNRGYLLLIDHCFDSNNKFQPITFEKYANEFHGLKSFSESLTEDNNNLLIIHKKANVIAAKNHVIAARDRTAELTDKFDLATSRTPKTSRSFPLTASMKAAKMWVTGKSKSKDELDLDHIKVISKKSPEEVFAELEGLHKMYKQQAKLIIYSADHRPLKNLIEKITKLKELLELAHKDHPEFRQMDHLEARVATLLNDCKEQITVSSERVITFSDHSELIKKADLAREPEHTTNDEPLAKTGIDAASDEPKSIAISHNTDEVRLNTTNITMQNGKTVTLKSTQTTDEKGSQRLESQVTREQMQKCKDDKTLLIWAVVDVMNYIKTLTNKNDQSTINIQIYGNYPEKFVKNAALLIAYLNRIQKDVQYDLHLNLSYSLDNKKRQALCSPSDKEIIKFQKKLIKYQDDPHLRPLQDLLQIGLKRVEKVEARLETQSYHPSTEKEMPHK